MSPNSQVDQHSPVRHPVHEVTPMELRAASALFPSGVTIVTRTRPDGTPYGMTVSSFTSLSLEPPLILVCIDRAAAFLQNLQADLVFAVNVLEERQQTLASRFADRHEEDRFNGLEWTPGFQAVPLLKGVVASFTCSLYQTLEGGDHLILLGAVMEIAHHAGRPLVWCDRGYHCLPALGAPGLT